MSDGTVAAGKIANWESSLLDLTVRNMLLSMRLGNRLTPIPNLGVGVMEDVLADGKALMLQPKSAEIGSWDKLTFEDVLNTQWSEKQLKREFNQKQLRTFLTQGELEKRMGYLYKQAKSSIAETGSNTLYLALGALRWIRPQDRAHRYAPLIMVPVDLNRKSVKTPYYLTARDEETLVNSTLIEMLRRDYKIEIEGLDPLPEDDFGIDIDKILGVFKRAIDGMDEWSIVETACLGLFSFSRFVMWKDIRDNADKLQRSKVVASLIGGRLVWDAEPMEIGNHVDTEEVLLPVEADASQLYAIREAVNGKTFVLHGPPGTGKSQTITGIIANALAHDKRVLFVAEKAAALNVVYNRLESLGIAPYCLELHSNKATKTHMLDQLQQASEAGAKTVRSSYGNAKRQIMIGERKLDEYANELHRLQPCGFTLRELISRYTRDEDARGLVDVDPSMVLGLSSSSEVEERVALADSMAVAVGEMGKPKEHPLKSIKNAVSNFDAANVLPRLINSACRGLDAFNQLEDLPECIASENATATLEGCRAATEVTERLRKCIHDKGGLEHLDNASHTTGAQLATILGKTQEHLTKALEVHELPDQLDDYEQIAADADEAAAIERLRAYRQKAIAMRDALSEIKLASTTQSARCENALQELEEAFDKAILAYEDSYAPNGYELGYDEDSFALMGVAARALATLSIVPSEWLDAQDFGNQLDVVSQLIEERNALEEAESATEENWLESFFDNDPDALVNEWNAANSAGLFKKGKAKRAFAEKMGSYAKKPLSEEQYTQAFTALREIRSKRESFARKSEPHAALFTSMTRLGEIDWASVRDAYGASKRAWDSSIRVASEKPDSLSTIKSLVRRMADDPTYPSKLQECVSEHVRITEARLSAIKAIETKLREAIRARDDLRKYAVGAAGESVARANETIKCIRADVFKEVSTALTELEPYFGKDEYADLLEPDKVIDQPALFWGRNKYLALTSVVDHLDLLQEWSMWLHLNSKAQRLGLGGLVKAFDEFEEADEVPSAFRRALYKMLVQIAIGDKECLNIFTGSVFDDDVQNYRRADERLREEARSELRKHLAKGAPNLIERASQGSDAARLKKAMRSRGRGTTIRKLFKDVPDLVQDLCPCMLMSPLSVAQYLDIDKIKFDIVIFDEASQLRTAMAVGALARSEDAIIVGDPNQMPPTTFFESQNKADDWTEEEDLESILEDCLAISMPETYLQWHYRSRHESLISFSNSEFYRNKLCTFPSADDNVSRVTYVPVKGYYEGSGACTEEAKAIVKEVKRRSKSAIEKEESLGIITFNVKQQGIVEDLLEKEFYRDSKFEAWANEVDEPLFVKNLENVQGDERDVILLSVTYGPDETGRTLMRFGPLSNEGGWRRLNVAITRARKEMMVFAVLDPLRIDDTRVNSKGVRALKGFLEYAKMGSASGEKPADADHEARTADAIAASICGRLGERGFETVRNVGNSSYKVDIAVVDPQNDGQYLAGILLDGDSYGHAKTTRDREISRTKMLEALGWRITNVWAMDWWARKDKVIEDLSEFLAECLEKSKQANKKRKAAVLMSAVVEDERDAAVELAYGRDRRGAAKAINERKAQQLANAILQSDQQAYDEGAHGELDGTRQGSSPSKSADSKARATKKSDKKASRVSKGKKGKGASKKGDLVEVKLGYGKVEELAPSKIVFVTTRGPSSLVQSVNRAIPSTASFSEMERALRKHGFLNPHRSYMVNPNHVDWIEERDDGSVVLVMQSGKHRIPVRKASKGTFSSMFEFRTASANAEDEASMVENMGTHDVAKLRDGTHAPENEATPNAAVIGWDFDPDELNDGADWF